MTGLGPARCPLPVEPAAGLVAARLRRGVRLPSGRVTGESDREVHLFSVPTGGSIPSQLTALCGLVITPGMADQITAITGMPCSVCLALGARGATG
jgi:hypothetical protein